MKMEPRFRVGPFQISGGGCMTLLIVLGLLLLCCPWSAIVDRMN